jgi:hypothetical protein
VQFWAGLGLGVVIGAGGTWLAVAKPWRGDEKQVAAAPPDAGAAPVDPKAKKKRKKRRGGGGGGGGGDDWVEETEAPAVVVSAADREMVWRGPAIKAPARSVDMGSDGEQRPLSNDEIDATMNRSSGPMLDCIRQALAGAELSGEVKLQMLVDPGGAVSKVRLGAPKWLVDHGFTDCASSAARRIRFPATGAHTVVDAPFHID